MGVDEELLRQFPTYRRAEYIALGEIKVVPALFNHRIDAVDLCVSVVYALSGPNA